ncbi:MAG TPA: hypothetical protein VLU43_12735 [Anaeromyxobacteraceae bacterium]|nr:hypothetical protein [Anaeromyxobacteraceae bacterium]
MTQPLAAALALALAVPAAGAAEARCETVASDTRRACTEAAPADKPGTIPSRFHRNLCDTAAGVAQKACDHGVFLARYGGSCAREAEYVRDAMNEACRIVLYKDPKPYVKVWFKMYDERCRKNARDAEERATERLCRRR